jgi:hypothetical protein
LSITQNGTGQRGDEHGNVMSLTLRGRTARMFMYRRRDRIDWVAKAR